MTFALKDFEELKKHFNDTVQIMLKNKNKDTIEDLPEPRKYEIQFLQTVLTELEKQVSKEKSKNHHIVTIFYGAMLLIKSDIQFNLKFHESKKGSLLFKRLDDGMGITDENKPSINQMAECFKALNQFITLIFENHDSREGLKNKHILQSVPFEQLISLVNQSYTQEKIYQNEALSKVIIAAKTSADASTYKITKEVPLSALNPFNNWKDLQTAFSKLVLNELADKSVENLIELGKKNKERSAQLQFLECIEKCLSETKKNTISEPSKVAIFAGAMHIVRKDIALEYTLMSSESSLTHVELTSILQANKATNEDVEALIHAADRFLRYMTTDLIKPSKNKLEPILAIREKNLFSKIDGFNLLHVFTLINNMTSSCRLGAFALCIEKVKKEHPSDNKTEKSESYFTFPSLFSKKTPIKLIEKVKEEEKNTININ